MTRPAVGYSGVTLVPALVLLLWLTPARPGAQPQDPPPQTPTGQQRTFRTDVDYVRVDVYPRQRGRVVEDMARSEFQVFEDGIAQTIETFDYIAFESKDEVEPLDPRDAREALRMAADPQTRVFAIFLSVYHVGFEGSVRARQPLLDFVTNGLGPQDLFGIMTPRESPELFELGRRPHALASVLTMSKQWGLLDSPELDPDEIELAACEPGRRLVNLWRQHKTLTALEGLIVHLAAIRPERKNLIVISDSWSPGRRDYRIRTPAVDAPRLAFQGVPVQRGRGSFEVPSSVTELGRRCAAVAQYLRGMDMGRRMRELPELAVRSNVALYFVPPAPRSLFNDPSNRYRGLAEDTDGLSVISNDLSAAFQRVMDHQTGFYMLGYRSTQGPIGTEPRKIEVKTTRSGVDLDVKRDYLPPSPEVIASREGRLAPIERTEIERTLDGLERVRDTKELYVRAERGPGGVSVAAEVGPSLFARSGWQRGGDVVIEVRDEGGKTFAERQSRIEAGARGVHVDVSLGADAVPARVAVRVKSPAGQVSDFVDVARPDRHLLGPARFFRAGHLPAHPYHPAAEPRFGRTERLRLEWPLAGDSGTYAVRLLNAQGDERELDVALTEIDDTPRRLRADIRLLSVAAADYVLEITAEAGDVRDRQLIALRVTR
jgi:VWFA-related protein